MTGSKQSNGLPVIGIVDYGAGNLRSLCNAILILGGHCDICASPEQLARADAIMLPGVGSFGSAVSSLKKSGMYDALRDIAGHKPLLGICLGMQLLFWSSEESPGARGLRILDGEVARLAQAPGQKVPNMGWLPCISVQQGLTGRVGDTMHYYFAHSYECRVSSSLLTSVASRGESSIAAGIRRGMTYGVQFHPEKSGPAGLRVLERFLALAKGCEPLC